MSSTQYVNISAAHSGCGLLVGHQHFNMAALIEQKLNRISFVAADGRERHIIGGVVSVEEVLGEMAEKVVVPIIPKDLTAMRVTQYTNDGMIHKGPYEDVKNLEFDPVDSDFAFETQEGNRVTMSGGTIFIEEVWVDNVPDGYVNDAIKANMPDIVEQLFAGIETALADSHIPTIETALTENLPAGFVKHLLDTGTGFTSTHNALRAAAFAALGARLSATDTKVDAAGKDDTP